MGTISSGTGLISGLDIQALVTQLMQIESRPLEQLKTRITSTSKQQESFLLLNARLLATRAALQQLAKPVTFNSNTATSSDPNVVSASASETAARGTHSFIVKSLVSTHQLASRGFADRDSTPVGAGTLTFEIGKGDVSAATPVSALNGGRGMGRGVIRITDGSGASADIDLRAITDVKQIFEAINSQAGIRVKADVSGDSIRITDLSAGSGALLIADLGGGAAATDLGIAGTFAGGQAISQDLVRLADGTRLSQLNDKNGVHIDGAQAHLRFGLKDGRAIDVNLSPALRLDQKLAELNDGRGVRLGEIRLTNRAGNSAVVDLSGAQTLQDVATAISGSGLSIGVSLAGSTITITESSGGTSSNLKIEDVSGHAAADLGIVADVAASSMRGSGIHRVDTVGAVLRAIRYASGNEDNALKAEVSADGNHLSITDSSSGAGESTVEALNGSNVARDLGLLGGFDPSGALNSRRLVAGLNTVLLSSLNGGKGVQTGPVQFTFRDTSRGAETVDFSTAETLADVVERINAVTGLTASVSAGGTGITIVDSTTGTGQFQATDVSGTTVADLKLTAVSAGQLGSNDLQLQYIAETTKLSDLNAGKGINFGRLHITNGNGAGASLTLNENLHKTVGDVLKAVNDLGLNVTARINANGDGIEIADAAGAPGLLTVTDERGTSAKDLRILGTVDAATRAVTGTYSGTIEIDSDDTLDEVARKINDAGIGIRASVFNDGSATEPYWLSISSETGGVGGRVSFSTGGIDLGMETLVQGRDAVVLIGEPNSPNARVATSGSNTIKDMVPGLTLNLTGTSDKPVDVKVDRDVEGLVTNIKTFVKTFNDAVGQIQEFTKFVPETNERGVLLGNSTVLQVQATLYSQISRSVNDSSLTMTRMSQVGMTVGSGATLQFDEERFREAYADDPDAVTALFTKTTTDSSDKVVEVGFAAKFSKVLDGLTDRFTGTVTRAADSVKERVDLFTRRAEQMQTLLDMKEKRLLAQFQAMEKALAGLQGQQSSLASLSNLASSFGAT